MQGFYPRSINSCNIYAYVWTVLPLTLVTIFCYQYDTIAYKNLKKNVFSFRKKSKLFDFNSHTFPINRSGRRVSTAVRTPPSHHHQSPHIGITSILECRKQVCDILFFFYRGYEKYTGQTCAFTTIGTVALIMNNFSIFFWKLLFCRLETC